MKKTLISVAGYDPTSGAGSSLDLKVFHSLGYYGIGILTSLTAQNTQKINKIKCLSHDFILDQYRTVRDDIEFSGIKIGMLGCKDAITAIDKILSQNKGLPLVVDPVFKSSSGTWLLEDDSISDYLSVLKGKATILTPNLEETALICGKKISDKQDMQAAAKNIFQTYQIPCLIKGGHLSGQAIDLFYNGHEYHFMEKTKLNKTVHGTGCFLSSSILCYLANGETLLQACKLAAQFTNQAIQKAIPLGKGQSIIDVI